MITPSGVSNGEESPKSRTKPVFFDVLCHVTVVLRCAGCCEWFADGERSPRNSRIRHQRGRVWFCGYVRPAREFWLASEAR